MTDKEIAKLVYVFNPQDNGGGSVMLSTSLFNNGDGEGGFYTNQELILQSYCNSASLNLSGASITPERLRDLANRLETWLIRTEAEYLIQQQNQQ